jgi:chitodextrinase
MFKVPLRTFTGCVFKRGNEKRFWTFILFIGLSFAAFQAFAVDDQVTVTQEVSGICGNGICETGENSIICPTDCPVPPPPIAVPQPKPPSSILDIFPPRITDIRIQLSYNTVLISWKTSEPAISKLFWGKTAEYGEGVIAGASLATDHSALLTGLVPDTLYHFQIEARDARGNTGRTQDRTFRTLSLPDITPPANVSNFEAISGDTQITLQWKNPPDKDFKAVKIQRSTFFYPQDPFDGETIYNGPGESFLDTGLQNGVRYYYTAFAYDQFGNYSSGAVASAIPGAVVPPPEVFPPTELLPPELKKLTLGDFEFWQEGRKLPVEEGRLVKAKIGEPLTVSINYENVPEVLKTIMITLVKPDQLSEKSRENGERKFSATWVGEALAQTKTFSFLLRINQQKTRYEATLMPPEEALSYPMFINVMDFKHQALKRLGGELQTVAPPPPPPTPWYKQARNWRYLFYVTALALLLFLFFQRRRKRNKISRANSQPQIYGN